MKTLILLFALAVTAYAQDDQVHVVDNADQVQVVDHLDGANATEDFNDESQHRNDTQFGEKINPNATLGNEIQPSEAYDKPQTTTESPKLESVTAPDHYFARPSEKKHAIDASNYMLVTELDPYYARSRDNPPSFDGEVMPVVIPNPDPFFSQPHGVDSGYYRPQGPSGGYEPISTGPAYVDNGEVRPSLPYPYKERPYGARGGK